MNEARLFYLVVILGIDACGIIFLLTLQKALRQCSLETRTMEPGLVWLSLIPIFNYYWRFVLVVNLSKSLAGEFHKRGIDVGKNPGQAIGLTMCILVTLNFIVFVTAPFYSPFIIGVPVTICWVIYWVRIAGFSARLASESAQRHFDTVAQELRNVDLNDGIWARAFTEAGGENKRAKALYTELRVAQLAEEEKLAEKQTLAREERKHSEMQSRAQKEREPKSELAQGMVRCPSCGAAISCSSEVCEKCGRPQF
jgi:hypothetical protein